MTGSVALDVVIGLVFIYLLYSLLATILQEIISTNFDFRAKLLEQAIVRMLNDSKDDPGFLNALANTFNRIISYPKLFLPISSVKKETLAQTFYKKPLIKYLAEDNWKNRPSYLSAKNFSNTLIDILRGSNPKPGEDFRIKIQDSFTNGIQIETNKKIKDGETFEYLQSLWADSNGDIEKYKSLLEQWFDDTMKRTSGWYKQHVQVILFAIGLLIAGVFNVDTLLIVKKLSNDPKLRLLLVQQAEIYVKDHPHLKEDLETFKRLNKTKDTVYAQVQYESYVKRKDSLVNAASAMVRSDIKNINELLALGHESKEKQPHFFLGWLLTAIAISLGAPFWFDLLNKLMKLRSSLETSTSETNKFSASSGSINPKG